MQVCERKRNRIGHIGSSLPGFVPGMGYSEIFRKIKWCKIVYSVDIKIYNELIFFCHQTHQFLRIKCKKSV